jgi:patatin-related protein
MREKELRLALVCYGGISLAVYMHGITKEIWHLGRASRDFTAPKSAVSGTRSVYHALLKEIALSTDMRIRVITDIVAGASAGGINGIFLAQAINSGQSLEPLTDLWLGNADVDKLLDPDARPAQRFTKFWATPLVWLAMRRKSDTIDRTVAAESRAEVRLKLSRFIRSRWFQPPFGGETFSLMLLEALDAMEQSVPEAPLLPDGHPLDLIVTVTDFEGYPEVLRLNTPPQVIETEHRLTISFRARGRHTILSDAAELVFAARATASFPGAFPPFTVRELDILLAKNDRTWASRARFLSRILPRRAALGTTEDAVLIDGSVLSNAPFAPAINVLKNRPSRREVDRRFVYIDPKPSGQVMAFKMGGKVGNKGNAGAAKPPGFLRAILGSLSDIPREQPIRDNLDAIESRSRQIRRMRRITDALREEIERDVEIAFGRTLFLDKPTPARLNAWRAKAQSRAAIASGFTYPAYAHIKLSGIVEDLARLTYHLAQRTDIDAREDIRQAIWSHIRTQGIDQMREERRGGARPEIIDFFRDHDLGFRIRRLRFMARRLNEMQEAEATSANSTGINAMRDGIYAALALYQECEDRDHYGAKSVALAKHVITAPADAITQIALDRNLRVLDEQAELLLADGLAALSREQRRPILLTYLGFPFYDIATLPLLQGEGLDEFDPIQVDRISPDDCTAIRHGGASATLRGIEFNNFGAFFSRSYRENDYLWGRLHGAERLIDLVLSTLPPNAQLREGLRADYLDQAFAAILDEEEGRLTSSPGLITSIRQEIAARKEADQAAMS